MDENWLMAGIGAFLMIAAFAMSGVSDRAMPSQITQWYPPTRTIRVTVFVLGSIMLVLGIVRLVKG
jgi:hypothetical protein